MAKELNKFMLSAIAIIGLIVIVLVGIAITTAFSKELRIPTIFNDTASITVDTLSAPNTSNAVGSTGEFPFLQELTGCLNQSSNALSTTYYTVGEGNKDGGTLTLNQNGIDFTGSTLNCSSVDYLANSDGQIAADKFSTGLGIFGTFSVIIILAIVGKAIISLFRKKD